MYAQNAAPPLMAAIAFGSHIGSVSIVKQLLSAGARVEYAYEVKWVMLGLAWLVNVPVHAVVTLRISCQDRCIRCLDSCIGACFAGDDSLWGVCLALSLISCIVTHLCLEFGITYSAFSKMVMRPRF